MIAALKGNFMKKNVLNMVGLTALGVMAALPVTAAKVYESMDEKGSSLKEFVEKELEKTFFFGFRKTDLPSKKEIYDLSKPVNVKFETKPVKKKKDSENIFKHKPFLFTDGIFILDENNRSK